MLRPKIREQRRLSRDRGDRIPIDFRELNLLQGRRLGLEAEKGGAVADIAEEKEGGDGDDEEQNGYYSVEIFREPCGEIEAFGLGEAMRMESGERSDLGFGGFRR